MKIKEKESVSLAFELQDMVCFIPLWMEFGLFFIKVSLCMFCSSFCIGF